MSLKTFIILICLILWGSLFLSAAEAYRFPQPEFSSGYRLPSPTEPQPTLRTDPMLALAMLILVLSLTAFLLYKRRSRAGLRVLIILALLYFGFYHGGCICSVGSIQNVAQALFNRDAPIALPVIGAFLIPLLFALFFGRIFCGAACPLGAIQELVILHPIKVPHLLDRCLKLIPYIYLGLAVLFAANSMSYIICQYDPFVGFFRFSAKLSLFIWGGVVLLIGTVIARPYCRYLCPYSVLLKWTAKLSPRKVSTAPDHCVVCHFCRDACPVDAIQPPRPRKYSETKDQAMERMRWILALSPLLLIIGLLIGSVLSRPITRLHPDIAMLVEMEPAQQAPLGLRDVYNKGVTATESFLMKGGQWDELSRRALDAQRGIHKGSVLFGGYLALVIAGACISANRRRMNEEYTVNVAECISCARCYRWCPRGKQAQG
jgi:NosR/NirI family nitrous oxide reductase transcriptional regulator